MSKYETLTVSYVLDGKEMEALCRPSQKFREYVDPDGNRPFVGQSVEKMFETAMTAGSR